MRKRTRADIDIKRGVYLVQTVPITPQSVRKYHLMTEDCIVLRFSLAESVPFQIGDWFEDELFGKFVLRTEQLPNYNRSTGGFDYELTFDKEYRRWDDYIFMLPVGNSRTEPKWQLTDNLAAHAEAVISNLIAIGWTGWTYEIDNDCKTKNEIKYISYDGVHIIAALTDIAEAYECEWWLDESEKKICFGKCEREGLYYDMVVGDTVESMDISRNENDYANRYIALGSTRNLPTSYRRSLTFKVGQVKELDYYDVYEREYIQRDDEPPPSISIFLDTEKKVTKSMLMGGSEDFSIGFTKPSSSTDTREGETTFNFSSSFYFEAATYNLSGNFEVSPDLSFTAAQGEATYVAQLKVYVSIPNAQDAILFEAEKDNDHTFDVSFNDKEMTIGRANRCELKVSLTIHYDNTVTRTSEAFVFSDNIESCVFVQMQSSIKSARMTYNGSVYWVTLIDYFDRSIGTTRQAFIVDSGNGEFNPQSLPTGFAVGAEYTLNYFDPTSDDENNESGLIVTKVPASWFLNDFDDPSSLRMYGEQRLRLPMSGYPDGYAEIDPNPHPVEQIIVFEEIFPKCYLKVTSVTEKQRKSKQSLEDGSTKWWDWTEFSIEAENFLTGQPFPFSSSFIKDGEKLESVWLSDIDTQDAWEIGHPGEQYTPQGSFQLSGMNFGMAFNNATKVYTIVRNQDYGAMFPNDMKKPAVGDVFVLTGWDVRAMASLNLIETAEQELADETENYLEAVEEGQFTFTCHAMSDFGFDQYWFDSAGVEYEDYHARYYEVDGHPYGIMKEGTGVRIRNVALENDKITRVIGYELKLDFPYDTPTYECGETDAFSRLKQIEKKMTRGSDSASYSGSTKVGRYMARVEFLEQNGAGSATPADLSASYLSKKTNDTAQGTITFNRGFDSKYPSKTTGLENDGDFSNTGNVVVGKESPSYDDNPVTKSLNYVAGHSGWNIDNFGNGELESLTVRSFLKVTELLINRLQAQEGDTMFSDNDQIIAVEEVTETIGGQTTTYYILTLKEKWEGYFTAQQTGNIVKGIVNTLAAKAAGVSDEESTSVETDGVNKYYTSWMRVVADKNTDNSLGTNQIKVTLYGDNDVPAQRNFEPCKMMTIARWGCYLDPEESGISAGEKASREQRQRLFFISTSDGRIMKLRRVNKPILENYNYGTTLGTLPEFVWNWPKVRDEALPYRDYLYAQGVIVNSFIQVGSDGEPITEYVDMGEWQDNTAYLHGEFNQDSGRWETHDVWYYGCKWRCLQHQPVVSGGTSTYYRPVWGSPYWQLIEGNENMSLEFVSSNGTSFRPGYVSTTITPYLYYGNMDISTLVGVSSWSWTRKTENAEDYTDADLAWNATKVGVRVLPLTNEDMPIAWSRANKAVFTCTVTIADGNDTVIVQNQVIA